MTFKPQVSEFIRAYYPRNLELIEVLAGFLQNLKNLQLDSRILPNNLQDHQSDFTTEVLTIPNPAEGEGWSYPVLRFKEIYLDSPFGFLINYENKPQVYTSFEIDPGKNLKISQIQGVKNARLWFLTKPSEIILNALIQASKGTTIPTIKVKKAENLHWIKKAEKPGDKKDLAITASNQNPNLDSKHRAPLTRLQKIYDQTCQRLSFETYLDSVWWSYKLNQN